MTKITILFICISLIVRFVYPQISFSREWIRNRVDGMPTLSHKTRKSGNFAQWYPVFNYPHLIHENKKFGVGLHYRPFSPDLRFAPKYYMIHPFPTFRTQAAMLSKRSEKSINSDSSYAVGDINSDDIPTKMDQAGNLDLSTSKNQQKQKYPYENQAEDFKPVVQDDKDNSVRNDFIVSESTSDSKPEIDWIQRHKIQVSPEFLSCILTRKSVEKIPLNAIKNDNPSESQVVVSESDLTFLIKLHWCSQNSNLNSNLDLSPKQDLNPNLD